MGTSRKPNYILLERLSMNLRIKNMRMKIISGVSGLAASVALLFPSGAFADDMLFGADSLYHLVREATVIVKAADPSQVEKKERTVDRDSVSHSTYSIKV